MIKFLKRIKRTVKKIQDDIQRKLAKDIDYLYKESPYNKLMVELDRISDFDQYKDYTIFREAFEKKLRKIARFFPYVKWRGEMYGFKAFKGHLSLREAGIDKTQLNTRMRFSIEIIKEYFLSAKKAFLTENETPYHKQLASLGWFDLSTSVYAPGHPLHQDMTQLTFADNSFDLTMSYEDLEHIPDYRTVLKELYRITKPGGHVLISVPFGFVKEKTLVRATVDSEGEITHLMEPDYHGDPVLPQGILCFYHFGWDLLEDFKNAGFSRAKVVVGHDIDKLLLDELLFIVAEK